MRPEQVLGCVYVPSDVGFAMWNRWPQSSIERDLARIREAGFGAVRIFIVWRDFEPQPGSYDATAFARLREFVEFAEREELLCVPALLTLFMNGELLDLPWREGRDLWSDPWMRRRAREFVTEVASALQGSTNVFAYDIGDELMHVDLEACERLARAEAESWQREMSDAIRGVHPGVPVFLGCDASTVFGTHPFGVDNAAALELLGVHAFPNFAPVPLDGVADPLSSLLPGFLVRYASAFGVPLVDELGAYGASPELIAGQLRAAGASALAGGARGLFAWFWQDVLSVEPPYDRRPHERESGLVDAAGNAKPGLAAMQRLFALVEPFASGVEEPSPVGVLVAERRAEPGNYLDDGVARVAQAAFGAYTMLTQEKLPVEFVRSPKSGTKLLICPGCEWLGSAELEMIEEFVAGGGHVWLSISSPLAAGAVADLCGGAANDFTIREDGRERLLGAGRAFIVDWKAGGSQNSMPVWGARDGELAASFADGSPAIWSRSQGLGRVWMAQLPLELQPFSVRMTTREARWGAFYVQAAAAAGVDPVAACSERWLELRVREDSKRVRLLAVNHSADALHANVALGREQIEVALGGKDFDLFELPALAPTVEKVSAGVR